MLSFATLAVYVPAVLLLVATPGPAILLTANRSLTFGRRAGFATAAGLLTGTCLLQLGASAGLSMMLQTSQTAYEALKVAGALYLAYLGMRLVFAGPDEVADERRARERPSVRRQYAGGVATELLNPKTAVFYVSVLPQFVDVRAGHVWAQLLLLGSVFVALAACSLSVVVLTSAHARGVLGRRPWASGMARRATGCALVGFGVRLALARR